MRSDKLLLSFIKPTINLNLKLSSFSIKKWVRNSARGSKSVEYANKANGNTFIWREINQLPMKLAKPQPEFLVRKAQCEVISLWRKSARREIDNNAKKNFLKSTGEVSHMDVHPWWINWQQCRVDRCGNVCHTNSNAAMTLLRRISR